MNISVEITGYLLDYLNGKVKGGAYKSRSEVVREAIRLMIREDLEQQLKEKGITPELLEELRSEVGGELLAKRFQELS